MGNLLYEILRQNNKICFLIITSCSANVFYYLPFSVTGDKCVTRPILWYLPR